MSAATPKVYSGLALSLNGAMYSICYLLTPEEKDGLQQAGLIGEVAEVIGLQPVAESLIAGLEKQMHTDTGGLTQ